MQSTIFFKTHQGNMIKTSIKTRLYRQFKYCVKICKNKFHIEIIESKRKIRGLKIEVFQ